MSNRGERKEIPENSVIITDLEAFVPENKLDNEQLYEELKDTEYANKPRKDGTKNLQGPEDIERKVGITERNIASKDQSSTDLAEEAGRKLLERSPLDPREKVLLLAGGITAEYRTPSIASDLLYRLNISPEGGFDKFAMAGHDVGAACPGWVYALNDARASLILGDCLVAMVFSTDTMSKVLKPESGERILFGDGATAAKLKMEKEGDRGFRINKIVKWSPPVDPKTLRIPTSIAPELLVTEQDSQETIEDKLARRDAFDIDGPKVYEIGIEYASSFVRNYLEENGLTLEDFDYVVPHQANGRMLDVLEDQFQFGFNKHGKQKMLRNIQTVGNTASSSIPLVLYDFKEAGTFQNGDRILTFSFGAGFTLGIADFEYID